MAATRAAGMVFGFGILVLAVGLFVAPLSGAPTQQASANAILTDGETAEPHDNLDVTANSGSGTNVTVVVTDTRNADRENVTLSPSENATLRLDGGNVTVTYLQYFNGPEYGLSVTYPPTFAYDDSVATFWENTPLLLTIIGFVLCLSGLIMAVRLA